MTSRAESNLAFEGTGMFGIYFHSLQSWHVLAYENSAWFLTICPQMTNTHTLIYAILESQQLYSGCISLPKHLSLLSLINQSLSRDPAGREQRIAAYTRCFYCNDGEERRYIIDTWTPHAGFTYSANLFPGMI